MKYLSCLLCAPLLAALLLAMTGCQEGIDDRVAREVKEHTLKTCPLEIAHGLTNDSITFDRRTRTVSYHFTMRGELDGVAIDSVAAGQRLAHLVANATNLRVYKQAGIAFRYIYYSESDGRVVLDCTFDQTKDGRR